jgi:hypothetical protein
MSRLFFPPQAVRVNSAGLPYAGAKANFYLTGTSTPTDTYQDNALGTAHANPVVADSAGQWAPIYLDPAITYKVVITDSSDNVLDTVDPVHSPIAATAISIADAGGYFAGADLETVLQDIGANYAVLADDEDISGDWTVSGSMNFQDNALKRAMFQDCAWLNQALASSGNAIAWNINNGNSGTHTLTENTTITFSNWVASDDHQQCILKCKQDGASGAYTLAFAGSVTWDGGAPSPVMPTANDAERVFVVKTWDGGTNLLISHSGTYS